MVKQNIILITAKKLLFLFLFTVLLTNLNAKDFSKEVTKEPTYTQKGEEKLWCPICGMSIKKHYKTSYIAKLKNGTNRQYCSIRCLTKDDEEYGIDKSLMKVIDVKSEKIIDAKKAFYVIGSKIKGTMSKVSKLAFEKNEDANEFIKKYGGKVYSFEEAFNKAKETLKEDSSFIKNKKIKKVYPKGKKIFEKLCNQDIDPTMYLEINELKADIKKNNLCKKLDESKLQAVALYLWDVKKLGVLDTIENRVQVKEDEKCPVCGMFVSKYPRWAAKIFYTHDDHKHDFSFDGVKDLMKFYFNPNKWGNYKINKQMPIEILVTDYYSQKGIDGKKAYYVVGSNVYGPMGNELIPFIKKKDALTFKKDHEGTKILHFDKILEEEVYKLDE
ncbi:MAG: hypothetical protein C0625_02910 [Arcobacter sp.]|nr:MAG: hypothetical protein C0625_02910 [Arcobacter sp.]